MTHPSLARYEKMSRDFTNSLQTDRVQCVHPPANLQHHQVNLHIVNILKVSSVKACWSEPRRGLTWHSGMDELNFPGGAQHLAGVCLAAHGLSGGFSTLRHRGRQTHHVIY